MTDESLVGIRWHTTEESYRDISQALEEEGATVEVEQERQGFVFVPIRASSTPHPLLQHASWRMSSSSAM